MKIIIVKSSVNNAEQIHISSALKQKKEGVHYLEEDHINYFKNAENIYKGWYLKKLIINGAFNLW